MTNKINGIDVSECVHLDERKHCNICEELIKRIPDRHQCVTEQDLRCEYYSNCYYKQLKRLQQELDIKEKMLDKFMIGSGEILEKLQKENEELKEKNKSIAKDYVGVFRDYQKYKQALGEIREQYVHSIFYKCDKTEEECPCHNCIILGQLDRVQNIVKIIDEVLNDRD